MANITILSEKSREGGHKTIVYHCSKCNQTTSQRDDVFRLRGCKTCNKLAQVPRQSHEDFLNKFKKADSAGEYELVSRYVKPTLKITVKHKKCGRKYAVAPYHFLNGTKCSKCLNMRLSHAEIVERFREDFNGYSIKGEIKKITQKIELSHDKCGHTFTINLQKFIHRKQRCPRCFPRSSVMEAITQATLEENKIPYIKEFSTERCRLTNKLRFDFAILGEGDKVDFFIELDGEQHFKETKYTNPLTKKRDEIKNEFCRENGYPLYRIAYYEKLHFELCKIFGRELIKPSLAQVDRFTTTKVNSQEISSIRKKYIDENVSMSEIGRQYGVSKTYVSFILKYKLFPDQNEEIQNEIEQKMKTRSRRNKWPNTPKPQL